MITVSMRFNGHRRFATVLFATFLLLSTGCRKKEAAQQDHPRLTPNVILRDITFRSTALQRDLKYRVVIPASVAPGHQLPVV
ncbi:MAG TPA: hypothetical protein VIX37_21270 [Candidatus Sulfotelmatobacter sp.]